MRDVPAEHEGADPVEDYLDRLLLTLSGPPRHVRHTLAEVEAHLHDAVAAELAAGKSQADAERAAVQRMGPVQAVTGRSASFARPTAASCAVPRSRGHLSAEWRWSHTASQRPSAGRSQLSAAAHS